MTTSTHQATWETYTQSWSETDVERQQHLFEQSLSPDCVYTDPMLQTTGYAQLAGYMAGLQKNLPGARFVTTQFVSHHDHSLAHWNMVDGKGNTIAPGISMGHYDTDGRLKQMTGFYEPANAG